MERLTTAKSSSATSPCPEGGNACRNGFRALAEFDKPENGGNGDGIIDERDAVFSQLRLWIDENHDGISQPNELHTLPELGVFSLALKYRESKRTDKFDNWFRYKAAVNPQPPDEDSTDGRWMFDVIFNTTGRDDRALPPQVEDINPSNHFRPDCPTCPTGASTALTDPLGLSLIYPQYSILSGIGNVARVTVSPSGTNWAGESITEAVSPAIGGNTCPTGFPNVCVSGLGGGTFAIGLGYQPVVCTAKNSGGQCTSTAPVGPLLVGTTNEFFDEYAVTSNVSLLDNYGAGNSCQQTCSQQYYNSCSQEQILSHTFTYTFTKSTISGTKVTLVTVSE